MNVLFCLNTRHAAALFATSRVCVSTLNTRVTAAYRLRRYGVFARCGVRRMTFVTASMCGGDEVALDLRVAKRSRR